MGDQQTRIDKWLWAVRLFKTRSLASEACRKNYIKISGTDVKPSREIRIGDIVMIRKGPVTYQYKVLGLTEKRMGAKLVPDFYEDITPAEDLEILEMQKYMKWAEREKGAGRPTKKDRRDLEDFREI